MTGSGRGGGRRRAVPAARADAAAGWSRGARWRRAVTLLAAALLAGLVSLLVQGTSQACTCVADLAPADLVGSADLVFVGTVVDREVAAPGVRWTFQVQTVHKGRTTATTAVQTADDSAACGVEFGEGERYVVFATGEDGRIETNLCSGTGTLDRADPAVLALLGEGGPADPDPATGASAWPVIGGVAAVLLIGAGAVLVLMRALRRA